LEIGEMMLWDGLTQDGSVDGMSCAATGKNGTQKNTTPENKKTHAKSIRFFALPVLESEDESILQSTYQACRECQELRITASQNMHKATRQTSRHETRNAHFHT
jgi:hypothetical protein